MRRTIIVAVLLLLACASVAYATVLANAGPPAVATQQSGQTSSSPSSVTLHRLWLRTIQANADSQPAYLGHVHLPSGRTGSVLYVVAGNNTSNCNPGNPVKSAFTYALDASSGSVLWKTSTSGPSRCTTSGPAISGSSVYAAGLDGKIHRYDAASGKETKNSSWPVIASLMPEVEKISANLTTGGRYVYATTSGFIGDQGHYEGHLVTINTTSGHANVFNTLCSSIPQLLSPSSSASTYCPYEQSGLFGRGEGVVDPVTHDVYITSGNGPWNGKTNWGDSILKLDPSGRRLLDSFTPTNQKQLADSDQDLGSTGPLLLPPVTIGHHTYHLLVQGGKGPACASCNGTALRLLNRDNLSGQGGPGHLGGDLYDAQSPGGDEVLTNPAVWKSPSGRIWIVVANGSGVAGYQLSSSRGRFRLNQRWNIQPGGTTPVISHGVLYVATSGRLRALDPATGKVLWSNSSLGDIHWEYPRVVGHRLFLTDNNGHVMAYQIG